MGNGIFNPACDPSGYLAIGEMHAIEYCQGPDIFPYGTPNIRVGLADIFQSGYLEISQLMEQSCHAKTAVQN
jgi:hypothetical protein